MKKSRKNLPGFTLLELLFAIILLGVMLSITLVAIIGMLRFYVFSNQVRQNQENGRNVLDTMTREIRFGKLLFPTDASTAVQRICVLDESRKQLIQYQYDGAARNLNKTTFSYSPSDLPIDCVVGGQVAIKTPTTKVNLGKMSVTGFSVIKTEGAKIETNTETAAVVIYFSYLTGQPDPANLSTCKTADIYCTSLELNTAVNIRGGEPN